MHAKYSKPNKMTKHKLFHMGMFLIIMACASFVNLNAQNLEKHSWKNRILIFKASDSTSALYQEQIKEFRDAADELNDRKFVLYKITGDDFEMTDFTKGELTDSGKIEGKSIEKILQDKENFEVILIGLDGGVKLRQAEVLNKEDLYKIVDVMPMRRNELRRKIE